MGFDRGTPSVPVSTPVLGKKLYDILKKKDNNVETKCRAQFGCPSYRVSQASIIAARLKHVVDRDVLRVSLFGKSLVVTRPSETSWLHVATPFPSFSQGSTPAAGVSVLSKP